MGALVFIILIWLSLVALVYQQYNVKDADRTLLEYWLLRFPFALHCGWLTAASVLNVNVLAVKLEASPDVQLTMGIVSLAYLHAVSVWVVFGFARPNFPIAGVLAWATGWISNKLQTPLSMITEQFPEVVISSVQGAAFAVSMIIVGQVVVRTVLLFLVPSCAVNQQLSSGEEEKEDKSEPSNLDKTEPANNV